MLLGDIGAGQFGKAMNNFLLWVNGIALIEAGRLSEATAWTSSSFARRC